MATSAPSDGQAEGWPHAPYGTGVGGTPAGGAAAVAALTGGALVALGRSATPPRPDGGGVPPLDIPPISPVARIFGVGVTLQYIPARKANETMEATRHLTKLWTETIQNRVIGNCKVHLASGLK